MFSQLAQILLCCLEKQSDKTDVLRSLIKFLKMDRPGYQSTDHIAEREVEKGSG